MTVTLTSALICTESQYDQGYEWCLEYVANPSICSSADWKASDGSPDPDRHMCHMAPGHDGDHDCSGLECRNCGEPIPIVMGYCSERCKEHWAAEHPEFNPDIAWHSLP